MPGFSRHKYAQVKVDTDLSSMPTTHPWLTTERLVVKPDQLIKRRGKSGLMVLDCDWKQAEQWIAERRGKSVTVDRVTGIVDHFMVERFLPHKSSEEYYICIQTQRFGDEILFTTEGGVDVGDVDAKAKRLMVDLEGTYVGTARDVICSF